MLILPAPAEINGDVLAEQLAAAGMPTAVLLDGATVVLPGLNETHEAAAADVVAAHPAEATTAREQAAASAVNETTIRDRAGQALADNKAFLALTSPTNAQNAAQVKALTRQVNGLIRLVLRRFDGTD